MKRVLVTGGSGFIGLPLLLEHGYEGHAMARSVTTGKTSAPYARFCTPTL